jgi:hypothetical protein
MPHFRDDWWYVSTGDGLTHLHSDGVIREGTHHEEKALGWYRTREEAQEAIDAYMSQQAVSHPKPTADAGIPDSGLPYAIRVYAQAKKVNDSLTFEETQKQTLEINSVSRDERDWHHPGERGEVITRIRWRHQAAKNIKDLAQTCVESEVARLAEAFMPAAIEDAKVGTPWSVVAAHAFDMAEQFLAERDRRALAIRTANVDSLLDPHNNQPKG